MVFDDIYINHISDNNFVILRKDGNNLIKYKFDTPNLNIPFGIENYKNKYIINIELDNNNDTIKKFYDNISISNGKRSRNIK